MIVLLTSLLSTSRSAGDGGPRPRITGRSSSQPSAMTWCFFTLVFLRVAGLLARVATELASAERICEEQTEAELACAEQTQKEQTEAELACAEQTQKEQIFWAVGLSSGLRAASCCTALPVSLPEFSLVGRALVLQNGDLVQVELASPAAEIAAAASVAAVLERGAAGHQFLAVVL
jgi:hypothetical protein